MALKITSAEFIISAPSLKEAPTWKHPEIAMVGRSNVGKSSLINMLTGRKGLAKTSNTPGKTRLINFYNINESFSLVDLPGYGYAKVSKTMQAQWQKNLRAYLQKRQNLVMTLQLIDARHPAQDNDKDMLTWLLHNGLPTVVVLTKVDKISRNDLARQTQAAADALGITTDSIVTFSAESGWGKEALLSVLQQALNPVAEDPALR